MDCRLVRRTVLSEVISATKLTRTFSTFLRYLEECKAEPIFIERKGEIVAVLIGVERYRELLKNEGN